MDPDRMADLLGGPLQGVLSLSRHDRGPVAVPILVKDRGESRMHEWRAAKPSDDMRVAVLVPELISGYESRESLDG